MNRELPISMEECHGLGFISQKHKTVHRDNGIQSNFLLRNGIDPLLLQGSLEYLVCLLSAFCFLLFQSGHLNATEVDMNEVEAAALELQKVSAIWRVSLNQTVQLLNICVLQAGSKRWKGDDAVIQNLLRTKSRVFMAEVITEFQKVSYFRQNRVCQRQLISFILLISNRHFEDRLFSFL